MSTSHGTLNDLNVAYTEAKDPGTGEAIEIKPDGWNQVIRLIIAASTAETNTLAAPTYPNQRLKFIATSVGSGGTRTITVASGLNLDADTTLVFDTQYDWAVLESFPIVVSSGAMTYKWRIIASEGVTGAAQPDAVFDSLDTTTFSIGGTAVTATAAEINRAADLSARIVPLAVTTAITEAAHEGRTVVMSGAGSARTFTLPAATGAGGRYRFVVGEVNTSNYLIKATVGSDLFEGIIIGASTTDSATDAPRTWLSGATDDTLTLNGTTTGGAAVGDWVEFEDISATGWAVRGMITQSGTEATPFSDTVA